MEVALEWAAFGMSLICSWVYGYRNIWGPVCGVITAVLFLTYGMVGGVYAAAAVNLIFLAVHIRNGRLIMTQDPKRLAQETIQSVGLLVDRSLDMPDHGAHQARVAVDRLARICHQASRDAGWWSSLNPGDPVPNPLIKVCLMHSEISEAMEADRKTMRDDKLPHYYGDVVELADLVIRVCDLAGAMELTIGASYLICFETLYVTEATQEGVRVVPKADAFPSDLARLHALCSWATKELDQMEPNPYRVSMILAGVLRFTFAMAKRYDLPLGDAIAEKMEFNANRPDHKIENRKKQGGKSY